MRVASTGILGLTFTEFSFVMKGETDRDAACGNIRRASWHSWLTNRDSAEATTIHGGGLLPLRPDNQTSRGHEVTEEQKGQIAKWHSTLLSVVLGLDSRQFERGLTAAQ